MTTPRPVAALERQAPADPLPALAEFYGLSLLTLRNAQDFGPATLSRLLAVAARRRGEKAA